MVRVVSRKARRKARAPVTKIEVMREREGITSPLYTTTELSYSASSKGETSCQSPKNVR
jgi:hypothetical protein